MLLVGALCAGPPTARAATTSYDVGDQAVVQVIGRNASITIRTWNRNTIQIDSPDGDAFVPTKGTQASRASFLIPTVSVEENRSPEASIMATLLPEDFPVPKLAPGMHDVVRVVEVVPLADVGRPLAPAQLTVTIPDTTGLVNVRSGRGAVTLRDYRGTTIALAGHGRVVFENVSGDAFVQPLNGHFYAMDSNFDRLRIRSNSADEVFDACRARQIEATTLTGNIIFDNGGFDPGLARFESDRGSIALGVNGNAQLGAHTQDGHVLTILPAAPQQPFGREDGDGFELVGNGGPLVNASSVHGNVFLYDGSLADRRSAALAPAWHPMIDLLAADRAGIRRTMDSELPAGAHRPQLRRIPGLPLRGLRDTQPLRGLGNRQPPPSYAHRQPPRGYGDRQPLHGYGDRQPLPGYGYRPPPPRGYRPPPSGYRPPPRGFAAPRRL
jgi:hypothetical protein